MRFMMIIKADQESESGKMPSPELVAEMGRYNEDLVKAGVLLSAEGLHASADGARVRFSGNKITVTDGPFPETRDLIAGFWIMCVDSKQEAIEWAKRVPHPTEESQEMEIELRQIFDLGEFPEDTLPPEDAAREQALREQLERR